MWGRILYRNDAVCDNEPIDMLTKLGHLLKHNHKLNCAKNKVAHLGMFLAVLVGRESQHGIFRRFIPVVCDYNITID